MTRLFALLKRRLRPAGWLLIALSVTLIGFAQESEGHSSQKAAKTATSSGDQTDDGVSNADTGDEASAEEKKNTGDAQSPEANDAIDEDSSVKRITTTTGHPVSSTGPHVSPLVKAASSSSTTKSKKSFTDADLDKAKGSLIIVQGTNVREPKVQSVEERARESAAKREEKERETQNEAARVYQRKYLITQLEGRIKSLESEIRRLENEFYVTEEDDRREAVEEEFKSTSKALKEAKQKLSDLKAGGGA